MPKKKKSSLLLTLGGAALIIAGGVAAYWLILERNGWLGDSQAAAQLMPQDAVVAVSLSTDAKQWQQLREYGTPESQAAFGRQLQQIESALFTANGYNYQQDIQPWVGDEVMIAYLSPSSAVPAAQQSVVMALPIENPLEAKQVLEKTKSPQSGKLVERDYKGVQIREVQGTSAQTFSTALLGRFLVVTTDPKATERVIDTYQGQPSLAITPGYSQEVRKIKASAPLARMYVNMPAAMAMLAANSARQESGSKAPLSPQSVAELQQMQGVATTMTLEPEGIRFQGVSWLKPNSQRVHTVENNAKNLPRYLPADTLLMMSGGNLQKLWQDYAQGAQANPIIPISPESLRIGLKQNTGLDLDQDLLPWMAGEFSLGLVPTPQGTPSNLGAGVVLMVQASDRTRAEKALKQMDGFMAKQYQFQVQETQMEGQSVVSWTSPLGGVSATHGWLEGNVAFLSWGSPVASTFVPQPKAKLTEIELFNKAVPTQPSSKNGHFFIDMDSTVNAGNLSLPQISPAQKTFTNGIRAIGVTAGISDERSSRFDIFVLLKKAAEQPSPQLSPALPSPLSPTPQVSPTSP